MSDSSNDCCRAAERFCFRAFLVSFGFLLFWFVLMVVAWDWVLGIHGAMLGIEEAKMEQFSYDAKMLNYFLMGAFKLAAFLLFLIPWLVLRFSRN
ncbi:MAG: hypothetical protein QGI37_07155 [Verrucomicrobiota bacterium]|jgi:hypothetical protein|nr:hypothetical protein [Verrucomicrobiota bacterium]